MRHIPLIALAVGALILLIPHPALAVTTGTGSGDIFKGFGVNLPISIDGVINFLTGPCAFVAFFHSLHAATEKIQQHQHSLAHVATTGLGTVGSGLIIGGGGLAWNMFHKANGNINGVLLPHIVQHIAHHVK